MLPRPLTQLRRRCHQHRQHHPLQLLLGRRLRWTTSSPLPLPLLRLRDRRLEGQLQQRQRQRQCLRLVRSQCPLLGQVCSQQPQRLQLQRQQRWRAAGPGTVQAQAMEVPSCSPLRRLGS